MSITPSRSRRVLESEEVPSAPVVPVEKLLIHLSPQKHLQSKRHYSRYPLFLFILETTPHRMNHLRAAAYSRPSPAASSGLRNDKSRCGSAGWRACCIERRHRELAHDTKVVQGRESSRSSRTALFESVASSNRSKSTSRHVWQHRRSIISLFDSMAPPAIAFSLTA